MHSHAPAAAATLPLGQSKHASAASLSAYVPAEQRTHSVRAAFAYVPARHMVHADEPGEPETHPGVHGVHSVAESPENVPGGHAVHSAPFAAARVPAKHFEHTEAPSAATHPAVQRRHSLEASLGWWCPGEHGSQADLSAFA